MLESLKPFFNSLLRPLVRPLVTIGVRPNHVTLAGLLLFTVAAWFLFRGHWIVAFWLVVAGSLLDGLDGVLAREGGKSSLFGAILDSSCDRLTEMVLLFGLLGWYLTMPLTGERALGILLCYVAISLSVMVSYVKARCEGVGIACSRGVLQRPERLILLSLGLLFGHPAMLWILGVISLLGTITVIQRFVEAYRGAKEKGRGYSRP